MAAKKKPRKALFDGTDWADTIAVRAVRVGDLVARRMTELLTPFGITPLQYNVLRILYVRDEHGEGLPVGAIGGALVAWAPDVTRLIDRLEKLGQLERVRKSDDRRVVRVKLTPAGFDLVEKIHVPLVAQHHALLGDLSATELERIARGMQEVIERFSR